MINYSKILRCASIVILILAPIISIYLQNYQVVYGTNEGPYQSGYEHGVSDANGTSGPLYLEEPGKGFAFHTEKFNQGYIDGFCSVAGNDSSSDSDAGTFYCSESATQFKNSSLLTTNESSYQYGFVISKNDTKKNVYDVTNACNYGNWTADQTYSCLNSYYDGTASPYRAGYQQGVQGIELQGTHTQEFMKGYIKGLNGYWSNRG